MKTYGRLELDRIARRWRLADLSPHVAIAFKRVFPRVRTTAEIIAVADADDVRADLHWFMQRYPLAVGETDAGELQAARDRIAARLAERERLLLPDWHPGDVAGFREGLQPYPYQAAAAKIAIANGALMIGDDVGLGKTISAIAALTMGAPLPAAIVVQAHLAGQWKAQIEKFTTLRAHIIAGRTPYDLPPADVYIFRYSNITGWVEVIAEGVFKSAVFDEVQELRKGTETAKGQACAVLCRHARLRIGLTATPVYNYGNEMHEVMGFIQPDLLGTPEEFVREWCGKGPVVKDPDGLGSYLRETGYFIRRAEDDPAVLGAMPPANILDWEIGFDHAAVDADEELTKRLAMAVLRGGFVDAGKAARELDLRMRMLTGIGKAKSVAAYVRMLLKDSPRVLLAGWHREVYDVWRTELADLKPVLYTGSETTVGKARSVEAFTQGDSRVMMISLRSGVGLDGLQYSCRDVVFGELDWSPQVHYQIIGRLRRPGQTEQVTAHYLHAEEGSDPVLLEMLGVKTDQSRGINAPGQAAPVRFSDDSRIRRLAQHVLGEDVA